MRFCGNTCIGTQTIDVTEGRLKTHLNTYHQNDDVYPMYVAYDFQYNTTYSIAITFNGTTQINSSQFRGTDFAVYIRDDSAESDWHEDHYTEAETWPAPMLPSNVSERDLVLMNSTSLSAVRLWRFARDGILECKARCSAASELQRQSAHGGGVDTDNSEPVIRTHSIGASRTASRARVGITIQMNSMCFKMTRTPC